MQKEMICKDKIVLRTHNYLDYAGMMYEYENRMFRIIHSDKEVYVRKLFSDGIIRDIVKAGYFVDTWINDDVRIEGAEDKLVVEHQYIKQLSYCYEWTTNMFLDAMAVVAKLNVYLLKRGYELCDPHCRNVCFIGCKPVYTDMGSIMPVDKVKLLGWNVFRAMWINPNKLLHEHRINGELLRRMLLSEDVLTDIEFAGLSGRMRAIRHKQAEIRNVVEYRVYDNTQKSERRAVRILVDMIHSMPMYHGDKLIENRIKKYKKYSKGATSLQKMESGVWEHYQSDFTSGGKIKADARFNYYMDLIRSVQKEDDVRDVLEIAGNSGVLSQLLLENHIVDYASVTDCDAGALEAGYMRCRGNRKLSRKIGFSVMNLLSSTEGGKSRYARYKSDLVFALAVTHHLILTQKIRLSTIIELMDRFTRKYLIIEFMPLGLWAGDDSSVPQVPSWYTLDWFLAGVKERFEVITVQKVCKNRICVLGKKLE